MGLTSYFSSRMQGPKTPNDDDAPHTDTQADLKLVSAVIQEFVTSQ
jgi:hypothetical protein